MLVQSIPLLVLLPLFIANVCVKKRFFCTSSLVLFYLLCSFSGAVFLCLRPRTGEMFTDCRAMVFLSVCFFFLCLPALFYRDGDRISPGSLRSLDPEQLVPVAKLLAVMTFSAFVYFAVDAIPSLLGFLGGGVSRHDFRQIVSEEEGSFFRRVMSVFNAFSYCALFLGIYLMGFSKKHGRLVVALLVGGLSSLLSTLKMVARGGVVEFLFFFFVVITVFMPQMRQRARAVLRRYAIQAIAIVLVPFMAITAKRFFGTEAESEESFGYTIASYFCTGPYSFNATYVVASEYDMELLGGLSTFPFVAHIRDYLMGSSVVETGKIIAEEQKETGRPEFQELCGAFSGEFKTIVGTFAWDFPLPCVALMFFVFGIVFCFLFARFGVALASRLLGAIYFFLLMMSPIGFAYADRHRNIILLFLIIGVVYLSRMGRRSSLCSDRKSL